VCAGAWGKLRDACQGHLAYSMPMPYGKGRRKLLLGLGLFIAALAAIWLLCPVWFPWLLRPVVSRMGATIGSYQRLGYSKFSISHLVFTNESMVLKAEKVEALVPSSWLWRLGVSRRTEPFLTITNWDCKFLPSNKPSQPVPTQVRSAASAFQTLHRWLPRAVLADGTVASGDTTLFISDAVWNAGALSVELKLPEKLSLRALNLQISEGHPFEVRLNLPAAGILSSVDLVTNNSGLDIRGSSQWQTNRFDFEAHFGPEDTLPAAALLRASEFHIPGPVIHLDGYRDLSASLSALWQTGRFNITASAAASPTVTATNLPPINLSLLVEGNTNSAVIRKLDIHAPFLQAQLDRETALIFSAPYLEGPSTLRLRADLAQQHWAPVTGTLAGILNVSAGASNLPTARFLLAGTNVGNNSLSANRVTIAAGLNWPTLAVSNVSLLFDDQSTANLSGVADLDQKTLTNASFHFQGALVQRWLPADYSCDRLTITGRVDGAFGHLVHSGSLTALAVNAPGLHPSDLALAWNGFNKDIEHFQLRVEQSNAVLNTSGAFRFDSSQVRLDLAQLALLTNKTPAFSLAAPATLTFTPPQTNAGWQLEATPVRLTGPAGEFSLRSLVHWPDRGEGEFGLQRFSLGFLSQFTKKPLPQLTVTRLAAFIDWSNGPATLRFDVSGRGVPVAAAPKTQRAKSQSDSRHETEQLLSTPLDFALQLGGDAQGLTLTNLAINTSTSSVATAHGFLPLSIFPASTNRVLDLSSNESLRFEAGVRPEAFFWESLADLTGVRLRQPVLDLNVAGTWKALEGHVNFEAQSIQLERTNLPVRIQDLRLKFNIDRDKAALSDGQVRIQGQSMMLTGELPLGEEAWKGLFHKTLPPLDKASGHLVVKDAELAAFEPIFPQLLAPQGNLNLDLKLLPGARFEGALILRHARTRPLGNTAPIRDINVTLRFRDRFLALENATASLSGAEVDLTGTVDLRGTNWMRGRIPPFNLALHGTNVPLARQPEYIIRSDLDLSFAKTNDSPAVVSGKAQLKDSYYLSDLGALVPGKVATPSERPPFFSIDNPAISDWRLALDVQGVRWLKVRSSLFNGEVSANLHLEGTLNEPLALGVLKLDSGLVRFPFANLQVQQGLVTLASDDPYHPQLLIRAGSKQFGYEIRMEVSGSADAPIIQFTSNPSLSSEQILLMITAGQLPPGSFSLTPQQRAQTVALFLGRDLLSKLGLGDQSQERLTISSGQEISEQGRPTYHVEYKVSKRWSVEGEYDRFGDFNAGLKWRVYSK